MAKSKQQIVDRRDNIELRRWCVEEAIRWPLYSSGAYAAVQGAFPQPLTEPDVIKRANQLLSWVLFAPR